MLYDAVINYREKKNQYVLIRSVTWWCKACTLGCSVPHFTCYWRILMTYLKKIDCVENGFSKHSLIIDLQLNGLLVQMRLDNN